jgi:CO/xanthine dehydrogenase FAD-binding subunit
MAMIVEYHRPETLQAALALLSRKDPRTLPLGGGTYISHHQGDPIAVVDLSKLGLGTIERTGSNKLKIGATATLQEVENFDGTPQALKDVLRFEANYNLRQTATAAGTLVNADGKSAFACVLLALDARMTLQPGAREEAVEDWFAGRQKKPEGSLITSLEIPLDASLQYDFVGRSPQDLPVVSVAVAEWPTGRTRITIGGFGVQPILALDGTDLGEIDSAIKNACSQSPNNKPPNYILETATTLAHRLLEK